MFQDASFPPRSAFAAGQFPVRALRPLDLLKSNEVRLVEQALAVLNLPEACLLDLSRKDLLACRRTWLSTHSLLLPSIRWKSIRITCPPGATLLHVSLRDLAPAAVLGCDNVVDDVDHVLRAGTSLHLAEQRTGGRGFIRCSLPEVLRGEAPPRRSADGVVVFSPFGLGILDLAVGELAVRRVTEAGGGRLVDRFLPADGEA